MNEPRPIARSERRSISCSVTFVDNVDSIARRLASSRRNHGLGSHDSREECNVRVLADGEPAWPERLILRTVGRYLGRVEDRIGNDTVYLAEPDRCNLTKLLLPLRNGAPNVDREVRPCPCSTRVHVDGGGSVTQSDLSVHGLRQKAQGGAKRKQHNFIRRSPSTDKVCHDQPERLARREDGLALGKASLTRRSGGMPHARLPGVQACRPQDARVDRPPACQEGNRPSAQRREKVPALRTTPND
jgi:hypothetical protein